MAASAFGFAAVSRRDGSSGDGVHLMWSAPPAAGYSVHGYDIQRRISRHKPKITCHTLTRPELDALHELLRLGTSVADIAVARARCPTLPNPVPDQPVEPGGGKGNRECIDFERERFPDAAHGTFGSLTARQTAPSPGPPALRTVNGFRGLDCGRRLEIDLPVPVAQIEAAFVHFARPVKLTTLDSAGRVVGVAVATAGQRQPETLTLGAPGIARAVVEAPADEALLLSFCFTAEAKPDPRCVTFNTVGAGRHPNPLETKLGECLVVGPPGTPARHAEVRTLRGFTGLDCLRGVRIRLSQPAPAVRLALVTFAPVVRVEAFEVDGSHAGSAAVRLGGRPQTVALAGHRLAEIRIDAPRGDTLLLSFCTGSREVAEEVRRLSALARVPARGSAGAAPAPATAGGSPASMFAVAHPAGCLRYRLLLGGAHQYVRVTAAVPGMLAIALRDGKAVDSSWSTAATGVQEVTFELRSVDEILLYASRPVAGLTVCVDVPTTPADEELEWKNVPFIAKGVQLPLREVNPALTTAAGELALARSRLLPGESIAAADFDDLSRLMNDAVAASPASPVVHSLLTRKTVDDPFLEIRPWPLSLAAVADAGWRRALGFGWLDPAALLTPGTTYDYRITGHFRRRDVEEQLLAFHTVPQGTTLPPSFHLGPIHCTLPAPRAGRIHPAAPVSALRSTGRTGIPLAPVTGGGFSLKLGFDQPVLSVVLELEPAAGGGLSYEARSTDFFLGATGITFSGPITAAPRVTLDFASPIDTLVLRGHGLLYGVRLPAPSGGKSDDVIARSVVLPGVRFDATSPPAPPPALGTTNLQEPILPGDPAITTQAPPQALGFRLHWVPPPSGGAPGPMPWPIDLGAFPPFDVLGFQIERRRVDTSGPFEEVSGTTAPLTFFGNRNGRRTPDQITWGIDLLQAFPERAAAGALPDAFMTAEDVLRGPESPGGPPPGSTFQYRIYSVDAIGRRSAAATLGSVVRLEKHLAPPSPPGPPPAVPPRAEPAGVRARVLQKSDPDLPPDDVALLGASTNAIVLEWGWTADERSRDPLASEFRIYWQPIPPDTVRGTLNGPASLVGGLWEMAAAMEQPVAADALKGRYLRAPTYPFKVASNTAGASISVRLEPSALEPAATPGGAPFLVRPMLDGSELRPARWAERTTVIPIGAGAPTPYVFRDRLTVDADHPSVRVWVGVSTADAQSYVPDELPASTLNGGRPGNESSIAAAVAEARYLGRPTFTPPPPLAVIPELVSSEPLGETVDVTLDLPTLLPTVVVPAGHALVVDRISAATLVSRMSRRGDGSVGVTFPDRTTTSYSLANAADQAALLAQIAAGEAARVEGRFIANLVTRFAAQFEALWERALPMVVPPGPVTTVLPAKAERHLYRIRLADPAGHVSAQWAMVPRVIRVVSTRAPSPPRLEMIKSTTNAVTVTARVIDAFDIRWLLLFPLADDLSAVPDDRTLERATVLRLPDRRDLYPDDGIRLRLADGTLLAPTVVDLETSATSAPPDLVVQTSLTDDYERRLSVWAIAMTRDGIPSRVAGPTTTSTGPRPLIVPSLTVVSSAGTDTATWGVPPVPAEVTLERTTDGGANWARVSPWLSSTVTTFALPRSGTRQYRLVLRARRGQSATGPAVTPT